MIYISLKPIQSSYYSIVVSQLLFGLSLINPGVPQKSSIAGNELAYYYYIPSYNSSNITLTLTNLYGNSIIYANLINNGAL